MCLVLPTAGGYHWWLHPTKAVEAMKIPTKVSGNQVLMFTRIILKYPEDDAVTWRSVFCMGNTMLDTLLLSLYYGLLYVLIFHVHHPPSIQHILSIRTPKFMLSILYYLLNLTWHGTIKWGLGDLAELVEWQK